MTSSPGWLDKRADFPTRVSRVYDADGPMAKILDDYRPREGQQAFAREVAKAIEAKSTLIAEAGTGTGKTFAYLVPAILAGVTTIVSTAGKSLQDQLFAKDLPAIRKAALGMPFTVALLKGRANYVCHYHLEMTASGDRLPERDSYIKLRRIQRFAATSETGDRAELPDIPEDDPLWPMVTSTRENCLGRERCPHWEECFVRKARERAQQSNVVIVNHHLYLSSLALRNSTKGAIDGLLPSAALTVIDEAHQLPAIASDFFGTGFSTSQLDNAAQQAAAMGARATLNGAGAMWNKLYTKMQNACRRLVLRVNELGFKDGDRVSFDEIENFEKLAEPFTELQDVCNEYWQAFQNNQGRDNEFDTLIAWFEELYDEVFSWGDLIQEKIGTPLEGDDADDKPKAPVRQVKAQSAGATMGDAFAILSPENQAAVEEAVQAVEAMEAAQASASSTHLQEVPADGSPIEPRKKEGNRVLWFTVGRNWVRFNNTPLSFARDFRYMREDMGGAWVFTSATLASGNDFTHFKAELGIDDAVEGQWGSPFKYWDQGCLYVPLIPPPKNNTREHTANVINATWPLINAAEGRTFVLCTSLAAVEEAARLLEDRLAANNLPYKLFVQGTAPKATLINEFRRHGNGILVGSMGFWEGVDVKGDALSLVIIDKIPFAPPTDPVEQARCKDIEKRGAKPFWVHTLPEAMIALKQGAGRLIRSETDRGMVVLCDARAVEGKYKEKVMANLPDFYRTRRQDKAMQFFLSPEEFARGLYR